MLVHKQLCDAQQVQLSQLLLVYHLSIAGCLPLRLCKRIVCQSTTTGVIGATWGLEWIHLSLVVVHRGGSG